MNIWTHFIGFVVFFYNLLIMVLDPPPYATIYEMAPIAIQLFSYQVSFRLKSLFEFFFHRYTRKASFHDIKYRLHNYRRFIDMYDCLYMLSHLFCPFRIRPSKLAGSGSFWNHLRLVWSLCAFSVPIF